MNIPKEAKDDFEQSLLIELLYLLVNSKNKNYFREKKILLIFFIKTIKNKAREIFLIVNGL